jgi:hypothetical protein
MGSHHARRPAACLTRGLPKYYPKCRTWREGFDISGAMSDNHDGTASINGHGPHLGPDKLCETFGQQA